MTVVQFLYSGLGGHSSVGFSLIEADAEKKHDHWIIFYGIEDMPQSSIDKCNELGIEYYLVKKRPGLDFVSQRQVISLLKKIQPAIILLHCVNLIAPVYYYGMFKKTRIIAVEHQPNHMKTRLEWVWSVLIIWVSKKTVYLTDLYKQQMKQKLLFLFREKGIVVINNGINIAVFKPSQSNVFSDNSIIKIGMLARLTNAKDHGTLIKAFKLLGQNNLSPKQLQLHLAGTGNTMEALKQLANDLGIADTVYFRGMIAESEAVDFLNELNIYVHASLGETMSTSIMQAMACARPIIASDVNGINNMVIHQATGILVPPVDVNALVSAMEGILNDVLLQKKLGEI
jgi:glycosyltransferase involved in cell wall biosynthesis